MADLEPTEGPRAGRVAIVGAPNVGKSTLLNAVVGQKLAIASAKPQTTRQRILAVYASDTPPTQIAFVDTPGLHRPQNALGRALVEEAQGALNECDLALWLMESPADPKKAAGPQRANFAPRVDGSNIQDVLRGVDGLPVVIALNKVDRLRDKTQLLPLLEELQRTVEPRAIVPISALKRKGLAQLLAELRRQLPEGVLFDDPDFLTDRPERFFVAELVREAVIRNTRQEIPYAVAVVIDSFEETGKLTRIEASVVVEKENHKKIVVGARGQLLKTIGSEARAEIERLLERKVYLGLFVKVVPGWTEDPASVRRLAMEGQA